MAKATGAEILDFYNNHWPGDDWFIDDYSVDPAGDDGVPLNPAEKYDLADFGFIMWQGAGDPPKAAPVYSDDSVPFAKWFNFWKLQKSTCTHAVTLPKAQEEEFKKVCKAYAWKVS